MCQTRILRRTAILWKPSWTVEVLDAGVKRLSKGILQAYKLVDSNLDEKLNGVSRRLLPTVKLIGVYDTMKTTKCAVVIMTTWTELSFMQTYIACML